MKSLRRWLLVLVRWSLENVDVRSMLINGWTGQAGLNVGARLQSLGVSCLIVDKNERVGDNWRNRYRVSVLEGSIGFEIDG